MTNAMHTVDNVLDTIGALFPENTGIAIFVENPHSIHAV